jgi:hypothetical protein
MFGENDAEGISLVLYFKLSDYFDKEISSQLHDSIKVHVACTYKNIIFPVYLAKKSDSILNVMQRLMSEEMEKVKGFLVDSMVPYTEMLKILSDLANPNDLQLSTPENKLLCRPTSRSLCYLTHNTNSTR